MHGLDALLSSNDVSHGRNTERDKGDGGPEVMWQFIASGG